MKTIQLKIEVDGTEKIIDDLAEIDKEINKIKKDTSSFNGGGLDDLGNAADQASQKVKSLGDDVQNASKQAANSEENLVKLSSGAKVLAGSIDIATAAISSLGIENEDTEKQILKLQQTLTLTRGLVDFTEGLDEIGIGLKRTTKDTGDLDKASKLTGKGLEDTGKKTKGLGGGLKGLGEIIKANPILTLAGVFVSLLAATGKLDDLIKILGETFGQVFDALKPVLDILTDVLTKALDPLLKVLGPVLVPVLKLALIPIQLLGKAFEFLSPVIEFVGEAIAGLALFLGGLADAAQQVISGVLEFVGISTEQEQVTKNVTVSSEQLTKAYNTQKEANDRLNNAQQFQIDLLKAQGAGIREVEEAELKLAETKALQAKQLSEETIRKAQAALLATNITKEETDAQNAIIQQAKDDQIAAERAFTLLSAKITTDRNNRAKEQAKTAREKQLKDLSDAQKKELDKIKEGLAEQERQYQLGYEDRKQTLLKSYEEQGLTIEQQERGLAEFERNEGEKRLNDKITFLKEQEQKINNNTKLNAEERKKLVKELEAQISALETDAAQKRLQEQKRLQDEELAQTEQFYQDLANARNLVTSKENLQITQNYLNELNALNEQYRNGEIKSEEEFQQQLTDLDEKYDDIRLQNQLNTAQQELTDAENRQQELLSGLEVGSEKYQQVLDQTNADIIAKRQAVADKEVEIAQDTTEQIIETEQKRGQLTEEQLQRTTDSLNTFSDALGNLTQSASENFDSLGFSIVNAFQGVSAGASELFGTLTADVQDLGPQIDASTEKTASNATKLAAAFGAVGDALASVGAILQEQTAKRLDELQTETDARRTELEQQATDFEENIQAQVEAGVITQEQADIQVEASAKNLSNNLQALEADRLKKETDLKRKAFQQEKSIRIAQAVAQGAQAALAGYASGLAIPVVGPAVGAAYAAVAGVITAAQVAIIAKQKFPEPGSTSTSTGGSAFSAPAGSLVPTQSPTNLNNDIFTGASQQETIGRVRPPIIRAYVTESDITSTQNRIDRIQNQSEL